MNTYRTTLMSRALFTAVAAPFIAFALSGSEAAAQLAPYSRGTITSVNDLRGDFVAAGVGLRGSGGSGSITVVGIPGSSTVKEAILYWTILGDDPQPDGADALTFNGQPLLGTLIGTTASPCQTMSSAYVFRADATPWVSGNGSFGISGALDSGNASTSPVAEGASLVVIYSCPSRANKDIVVYDGAGLVPSSGATVTTTLSGFDGTSPVTGASIAFIVADGEPGLTDSAYVDSFLIASNPFEGSDPPSSIAFWDTDTFALTGLLPSGASSTTAQVQGGTDCLEWVASPFSITSPLPDLDIVTASLTPTVTQGNLFQMNATATNNSGSSLGVTANVRVYKASGELWLSFLTNRTGTISAGSSVHKLFSKRIPTSLPGDLLMTPLYVLTAIVRTSDSAFLDDDYVVLYLQ